MEAEAEAESVPLKIEKKAQNSREKKLAVKGRGNQGNERRCFKSLSHFLIRSLSCSSFGLGLACLSGLVGFALNHSFKWASSGPSPIFANLEPLING